MKMVKGCLEVVEVTLVVVEGKDGMYDCGQEVR